MSETYDSSFVVLATIAEISYTTLGLSVGENYQFRIKSITNLEGLPNDPITINFLQEPDSPINLSENIK